MTIGKKREQIIKVLSEAGIEDARFICLEIISHFTDNQIGFNTDITDVEDKIDEAVQRVAQGYPYEYITGHKDFYRDNFIVSEGVLIPRSDSEILVEAAIRFLGVPGMYMGDILNVPVGNDSSFISFVDFCTGTGCIGISICNELLRANKKVSGTLVDISPVALQVSEKNIDLILDKQIDVKSVYGDVLNEDFSFENLDLIVSNPPYVTPEEMKEIPKNVSFEPVLALKAEQNGLEFYIPLAQIALKSLKSGGAIMVEYGYLQGDAVREIFEKYGFIDVITLKDFGGNDRVTIGRKK